MLSIGTIIDLLADNLQGNVGKLIVVKLVGNLYEYFLSCPT